MPQIQSPNARIAELEEYMQQRLHAAYQRDLEEAVDAAIREVTLKHLRGAAGIAGAAGAAGAAGLTGLEPEPVFEKVQEAASKAGELVGTTLTWLLHACGVLFVLALSLGLVLTGGAVAQEVPLLGIGLATGGVVLFVKLVWTLIKASQPVPVGG